MTTDNKISLIFRFFEHHPEATIEQYRHIIREVGLIRGLSPGIYGEEAIYQNRLRSEFGIYQTPSQFAPFLKWLEPYRAKISIYLEIGVFAAGQFILMTRYLNQNTGFFAVDITTDAMQPEALKQIKPYLTIADSRSKEFCRRFPPGSFDMVFIDGDHSYAGVSADWHNHGRHAGIAVVHDIIEPFCPDVVRFWQEVKQTPGYQVREFTQTKGGGNHQGIGVMIRDDFFIENT